MNDYHAIDKKSLIASTIILFLILSICGVSAVYVLQDPAVRYSQIMMKAAMSIREGYPEYINWNSVVESSRNAMIDELDRFSGYVDNEALTQFHEDLTGGYFGIGILIIPHELGIMILNVREGSPAANSGILNGDIFIQADSTSLSGLSILEAISHLKGEENTILNAVIFRPATNDTIKVAIKRQRIDFEHIPYAGITSDSVLYIRLFDFNAGAASDMHNALDSLMGKGGLGIQGLIIDLRNNPGGLFSEARKIVELFLPKGDFIVGTSGRSKWNRNNFYVENSGGFEKLPLAIIVNKGSASASEILAGALRYSNHAVLIGDTTFGKGLVQGFINLADGDGLRLTISRYFFGGGRYINASDSISGKVNDSGVGLVPDILYSFNERDEFILALERSLLLIEFAHNNQDELSSSEKNDKNKQIWVDLFRKFAKMKEFEFESETTQKAKYLRQDAESRKTKEVAEVAVGIAVKLDDQLFEKHSDYVWLRLRQIAFERKFGTYRAYHEVVVPESEVIQLAAAVVKEKSNK